MAEDVYRPSWKVRLRVRLDEFGDKTVSDSSAPVKKKFATQLKGKGDPRDNLQVVPDPDAPQGATRYLLEQKASKDAGTSDDGLTFELGALVPRKASWRATGVRTANELQLEVKFLDLPLDPRVIRSCAVKFYLGTVTDEQFAAGVDGGHADSGETAMMVPDQYVDQYGQQRTNERFEGWVDEWEVEWPDQGEPFVSLRCRDNTGLLIEQPAAPQLAIDDKKPIDQAVAAYLANYPQFAGLSVEYRPGGVDVPKLSGVLAPTAYKPKIGPVPSKGGGGGTKLAVWDYLTDACGVIGHIVHVEGTVVVIQRARTLTSNNGDSAKRDGDPYRVRVVDGTRLPRRAFVYGRNVKSMKVARKYGRSAPQNIEVRSYNAAQKTTLVARFPDKTQPATDVLPGDGKGENKVLVVRISGVADEKALRLIAQTTYEMLGRNELSVHLETKNLSAFGGSNEDPDLLDLAAGDAIDVLVHRELEDGWSTLNNVEAQMLVQASARQFLLAAGYTGAFADAYAKAYESAGFQQSFILRGFSAECSQDDGVSLSLELVNYLEVRADKVLPQGEEQVPAGDPAPVPVEQPGAR